jgi:hypothetical protein
MGCGGERHATREALAVVNHFIHWESQGRTGESADVPRCARAPGAAAGGAGGEVSDTIEVIAGAQVIGHRDRRDTVFVYVEYTLLGSATLREASTFRRYVHRDTLTFTVLNPRPGSPAILCRPHAARRLSDEVLHEYLATLDDSSRVEWERAIAALPH